MKQAMHSPRITHLCNIVAVKSIDPDEAVNRVPSLVSRVRKRGSGYLFFASLELHAGGVLTIDSNDES